MARVKTTTDREIVEAAARVIARVGTSSLRLSDVAAEVGLAPATLLQRFKTKQDLLLAVTALRTEEIAADFAERRAVCSSPLEALLSFDPKKRSMINSRQQIANSLACMQLSLTDAGFRHQMDLLAQTLRRELTLLIEDAVEAGELHNCQPEPLARAMMAVFHGSLTWWAVSQEGSAESHIQRDIDTLIGPYRTDRPPVTRGGPESRKTEPAQEPEPSHEPEPLSEPESPYEPSPDPSSERPWRQ
jgi:AcrR family transcriptional regulator